MKLASLLHKIFKMVHVLVLCDDFIYHEHDVEIVLKYFQHHGHAGEFDGVLISELFHCGVESVDGVFCDLDDVVDSTF